MSLDLDVVFAAEQVAFPVGQTYQTKLPGDICRAVVTFERKGSNGVALLWWTLAPGSGWPKRYNPDDGVTFGHWTVNMTADLDFKKYTTTLEIEFPADFKHSRVDCRIQVYTAITVDGKSARVLDRWWDDVYQWLRPEYRNLQATFS